LSAGADENGAAGNGMKLEYDGSLTGYARYLGAVDNGAGGE